MFKPIRILIIFNVLAIVLVNTILLTSNKHFYGDEFFTLLEAIGQVPFSSLDLQKNEVSSKEIWANNNLQHAYYASGISDNGNMMLYNISVHFLIKLFGTRKPILLCLLSLTGFWISLLMVKKLGALLFNNMTGWVACLLTIFHPVMLEMALELRAYSLATAFSLITSYYYSAIYQFSIPNQNSNNRGNRMLKISLLYGVTAVVSFFLHFLTVFILIGHFVFSLLFIRDKKSWKHLFISYFLMVLSISFWFFFLNGRNFMLNYKVFNDYFLNEIASGVKIAFGDDSFRNILNRFRYNLLEIAGYSQSVLKIRFKFLLVVIPLLLLVSLKRDKLHLKANSKNLLMLTICISAILFQGPFRYLISGSPLGMWFFYVRISIPFTLILLAFAVSSLLTQRPTVYTKISACFFVVFQILVGSSYLIQRYNPETSANFDEIANNTQLLLKSNEKVILYVPTFFDAQLISVFSNPESNISFVISDNDSPLNIFNQLKNKGFDHPATIYTEYMKIIGKQEKDLILEQIRSTNSELYYER